MLRPPVLLLCALLPALAHAEIYQWKDEKGRTHFGETVPEKYRKKAEKKTLAPTNVVKPSEALVQPQGDNPPAAAPEAKPEAGPTAEATPGSATPENTNPEAKEEPPVVQEVYPQDGTGTNPIWVRDSMDRPDRPARPDRPDRPQRPVQRPVPVQGR